MTSDFLRHPINRYRLSWVAIVHQRLEQFLFPAVSDHWLSILRLGLGAQVTLYCLSLRADWNNLFGPGGSVVISRDLTEAILSANSRFIPRLGWLVTAGNQLGFHDDTIVNAAWVGLLCAGSCLIIGLFSRTAAAMAWFLHLCAIKSASLQTYGMDNFTTIGLFYLMLAPLPDRYTLDSRIWRPPPRDPCLLGFFQRVLQLHLCIIYFFSGLTKSFAFEWWNGTSMWRSLTSAPFDLIPPSALASWRHLLPGIGIAVLFLEIGYPLFIWLKWVRPVWLICILSMHIAIGITMGLYLFAFVMIVLNLAAFGTEVFPFLNKIPLHERSDMLAPTSEA